MKSTSCLRDATPYSRLDSDVSLGDPTPKHVNGSTRGTSPSTTTFSVRINGMASSLQVTLRQGELIKAKSDSVVWATGDIDIAGISGGFWKGLTRACAGESYWLEHIRCDSDSSTMILAANNIGFITQLTIEPGDVWRVHKDGFFASGPHVNIRGNVQGLLKGLFSRQGFVVLEVTSTAPSPLFLSSFGAVDCIDLEEGETFLVDNGHLVAWPSHMRYDIVAAAKRGYFQSWKSGEGLMCRFHGPGRVYTQTHVPAKIATSSGGSAPASQTYQS